MRILGFQKTTLLDYPGLVAATIFLGGCNMRCPFCHNMNLVLSDDLPEFCIDDILSTLSKRKGILDGVCITGGEPTLYPDLPDFIHRIQSLGYKVKLDTNGTNPQMLQTLIHDRMIDYVAMDIKSSLNTYATVSGVPNINTQNIIDSISILNSSDIDCEFRTTLIREYHSKAVISDIALMLNGAKKYYLQNYVDSEFVPDHSLSSWDNETISGYIDILSKHIANVTVRGFEL